jgi:hypothetical protein
VRQHQQYDDHQRHSEEPKNDRHDGLQLILQHDLTVQCLQCRKVPSKLGEPRAATAANRRCPLVLVEERGREFARKFAGAGSSGARAGTAGLLRTPSLPRHSAAFPLHPHKAAVAPPLLSSSQSGLPVRSLGPIVGALFCQSCFFRRMGRGINVGISVHAIDHISLMMTAGNQKSIGRGSLRSGNSAGVVEKRPAVPSVRRGFGGLRKISDEPHPEGWKRITGVCAKGPA